ncbi:TniQ family protein [Curtobacterium sp. MCBA15_012]|uniref:TniQ family protein n=1 Tax=Curtobacterium sp. MCBA15_012 TaxID=1898738 RepID=UPI001586FAB4|nr:TniQ family protein [Curtobacterium sp. MCBA15_012]WIB00359.1 TniQ family protein [Curtobacterium sp. MCBA15_012]
MSDRDRPLRRSTVLSVRPRLYRDEWLHSAINRWAWYIFGVSRGTLLDEFGLEQLSEHEIRQLGNRVDGDVLANMAGAVGISADAIRGMTMATIQGPAVSLTDRPSMASRRLWARGSGTRYCPDCLRERPGVFLRSWRLTWTFACTEHRRILLDACPTCLLPVHELTGRSRFLWDPNRCRANIDGGLPVTPCGAELIDDWGENKLSLQSPVLLAQERIHSTIDSDPDRERFFSTLRGVASALRAAGEIDIIASLSGMPADGLVGLIEPEERVGLTPPSNAYAAAALFAAAVMVMTADDELMSPLIRQVTFARSPGHVPRGTGFGPGSPLETLARWGMPTGRMRERVLVAHDQDFSMTHRLVYGSTISSSTRARLGAESSSRRPFVHPSDMPPLLWTEWAARLDSGGRANESFLRAALTAAVLTVDNGDHLVALPEVVQESGASDRMTRLTRLLRPNMIGGPKNADRLVKAVTELAVILTLDPSPIDYRRRRELDWFMILTKPDWRDLCDASGHNPGGDVRLRNAKRYLFQRATLAPLLALPPELAMGRHRQDTAEYSRFRASVTAELQEGLDSYLRGLIDATGLREPVTWVPDRSRARLARVGRDLEDIDWVRLHELRGEGCPDGQMARELNRTIRHCLWAGDARPHPSGARVETIDWSIALQARSR